MTVEFVVIAGSTMAVLPVEEYDRLIASAEDMSDVATAEAAERRRIAGEDYVPVEVADRIVAGEPPLRVWREHRGLSLARLGEAAGIRASYLSEVERGLKPGTPQLWRKLANALAVTVDEVMPDMD